MVIMAWVSRVYKTIWSEEVTRVQKKEMKSKSPIGF